MSAVMRWLMARPAASSFALLMRRPVERRVMAVSSERWLAVKLDCAFSAFVALGTGFAPEALGTRHHTRHGLGITGIHTHQARMRVRRAHEACACKPRRRKVVGVTPLPLEQRFVFQSAHGVATAKAGGR